MSSLGIFIYGAVVSALVLAALGLIAWGITNERRDRLAPEQGGKVYGDDAAEYVTSREERPTRADYRQGSITDRHGKTREQRPRDHG